MWESDLETSWKTHILPLLQNALLYPGAQNGQAASSRDHILALGFFWQVRFPSNVWTFRGDKREETTLKPATTDFFVRQSSWEFVHVLEARHPKLLLNHVEDIQKYAKPRENSESQHFRQLTAFWDLHGFILSATGQSGICHPKGWFRQVSWWIMACHKPGRLR